MTKDEFVKRHGAEAWEEFTRDAWKAGIRVGETDALITSVLRLIGFVCTGILEAQKRVAHIPIHNLDEAKVRARVIGYPVEFLVKDSALNDMIHEDIADTEDELEELFVEHSPNDEVTLGRKITYSEAPYPTDPL